MKTLQQSTDMLGILDEEPTKFEKWLSKTLGKSIDKIVMGTAIVLAIALSIGLFFMLPELFAKFLKGIWPDPSMNFAINLLSGLVRILILIAYIIFCAFVPDVRRTFQYHVLEDMDGRIPLILDGGACDVGLESTVLDMTAAIPIIVRPGGVTREMLLTVLPDVKVADSVMRPLAKGEKAVSPGMMYRHYAPKGQLTLVKGAPEQVQATCLRLYEEANAQGHKACILIPEEHAEGYKHCRTLIIGSLKHPETLAHSIFAALRWMDDEQVEVILCETVETSGIGLALMNRLCRAAAFHVLEV